ncbi:MAG: ABC transporter permease [Planctomycetales bacterium]
MFTGSLALLHRALKLDARLAQTHLFRFGFVILIYGSLLYSQATSLKFGAPGLKLFEMLSYLNLGLITLAAISFFATAISEEKEEETLGLLKMAGINPIGILLGKSTSRLVGAILLLAVQFPFTLLAITLGGVTIGQVLSAYASLSAYLILIANLGLLNSVVARRGSSASALTVLALILYFLSGPLVSAVGTGLVNSGLVTRGGWAGGTLGTLAELGRASSVSTRLREIMDTGFAEFPIGFQVLSNVGLAGVCFLLAWAGFNRFTRDWRSTTAVKPARRLPLLSGPRRPRPGSDPLRWKEFQFLGGGLRVQLIKFFLYGVLAAAVFLGAERYYGYAFDQTAVAAVGLMGILLVLEASLYISRIFHDEWRERTLPLLKMLPITTPRLAYSKLQGCVAALLPALFWLIVCTLVLPDGPLQLVRTIILPSRWFVALVALLYLTLTAFFSMVVRWGALPLALAVMFLGSTCGGMCMSPLLTITPVLSGASGTDSVASEIAYVCVDAVIGLLIAGLQFDIHRRLEIVSSQ